MAMDIFVVLAASYDTLDAAESDYGAVGDLYRELGPIDTCDVAVLTRDDVGRVRIAAKHEQPMRRGAWRRLDIGLAGGALVALFPAIGLDSGLLLGQPGGAGFGAMAGHVTAGLRRADLKDLGELLDDGHSGLLAVAPSDLSDLVEHAIRYASKVTGKQLMVDLALVERDIDAAVPDRALDPDESSRLTEAAVQEAEAEAAAAEREAERYSTFWSPPGGETD